MRLSSRRSRRAHRCAMSARLLACPTGESRRSATAPASYRPRFRQGALGLLRAPCRAPGDLRALRPCAAPGARSWSAPWALRLRAWRPARPGHALAPCAPCRRPGATLPRILRPETYLARPVGAWRPGAPWSGPARRPGALSAPVWPFRRLARAPMLALAPCRRPGHVQFATSRAVLSGFARLEPLGQPYLTEHLFGGTPVPGYACSGRDPFGPDPFGVESVWVRSVWAAIRLKPIRLGANLSRPAAGTTAPAPCAPGRRRRGRGRRRGARHRRGRPVRTTTSATADGRRA